MLTQKAGGNIRLSGLKPFNSSKVENLEQAL